MKSGNRSGQTFLSAEVFGLASLCLGLLLCTQPRALADDGSLTSSGEIKSLNILSGSTGLPRFDLTPGDPQGTDTFLNYERLRLKISARSGQAGESSALAGIKLGATINYDQRLYAASSVGRSDFETALKQSDERQFVDLSATLVQENDVIYQHNLYRAYVSASSESLDLYIGRQLIPWGVGRFFTPTDVFSPLHFNQLELDERDGVDAVYAKLKAKGSEFELVYTPDGRELHPQREMIRVSTDIAENELGILGGLIDDQPSIGADLRGNVFDGAAFRTESLFRERDVEKNSYQQSINLDYSFENGLYSLVEVIYNGAGEDDRDNYRVDRLIRDDIQLLGETYVGMQFGYDLTALTRIEGSSLYNLDDSSLFNRIELRHSWTETIVLTVTVIPLFGSDGDEFNSKSNVYYVKGEWFF